MESHDLRPRRVKFNDEDPRDPGRIDHPSLSWRRSPRLPAARVNSPGFIFRRWIEFPACRVEKYRGISPRSRQLTMELLSSIRNRDLSAPEVGINRAVATGCRGIVAN